MTTMRDVAQRAGVSTKTVSRVVNGDRYVSQNVRARVEQAVADLRYVPNMLARTFRSGRDAAIGVAVPEISDPFFAAVTHAIEETARARGVAVFVTSVGGDGAYERAAVEALLGRQVVGLVATPVADDQSYLAPWQERAALVFIDRPPRGLKADTVTMDDRGGAREAVAHLLEHGHRRIAFLGDAPELATTVRRLEGYRGALEDAGRGYDPSLVALDVTTGEEAGKAVRGLLGGEATPTAVFSSNMKCTLGLVAALADLGRTDVPVVGFGDFPLAPVLRPALTVVDQDPEELGRFAAARLFDRVETPERRLPRNVVLPVSLIERASCAPGGTRR